MDVRASTAARDDSYTRTHILPVFGAVSVASVDQPQVRAWVAGLCAKGLAPATVRKAYQILGQLFAAAVDAKLIRSTPCFNVKLPKVEREEMRYLGLAEIDRLVAAVPARDRALILLACYGGLRFGEIAGLERAHVDTSKGRVRVAQTAVEVRGHLVLNPPKTRAARRTVPLPSTIAGALAEHLRDYTGADLDSPAFATATGERLRVNNWRRRTFAPALRAAGLEGLRVHDMRHTAVALWIATGAPALQISKRAGHASVSFTLDRYGHLYDEADDVLMSGLEGFLAGSHRPAVGQGYGTVTPLHRL